MAKKRSRSARRRGGVVQSLTEPDMMRVQAGLSEPGSASLLEPDTPVPLSVQAKSLMLHDSAKTKPEDEKVGMMPTQVRKAGRKTRRRARRGGGLGENSATWPPDKSSFGAKIGSPENTDNLIGYATKGGKRRRTRKSLKRK